MPTARRGDWTPSLRAPSYSVSTDAKPHAGFGLGLHNMQVKAQPTPLCDRTRTGWLLGCLTSHNQRIFTCSLQAAARGKLLPQSGTIGLREFRAICRSRPSCGRPYGRLHTSNSGGTPQDRMPYPHLRGCRSRTRDACSFWPGSLPFTQPARYIPAQT